MWDWGAFLGYYFHPLILKGVLFTLFISVASMINWHYPGVDIRPDADV